MRNLFKKLESRFKSKILRNSFWGLAGSLTQNVLLSLFYVLIARYYSVEDFSEYLIANSLYQMIVAFSAMGLGHWFVREVVNTKDKNKLALKLLKIQSCFGIFFFVINVLLAFIIYEDIIIRTLSCLFAVNIIFDNIIYSIKNINIAQYAQKKTVKVLTIEAIAKFGIACLLFIYPFNTILLVSLLVAIRFISLNLFLKIGSADGFTLNGFWKETISLKYVLQILRKSWPFAVIASAFVIYWKLATLIISKLLPISDVAHFENAYKILSVSQLLPFVISSTLFPKFVQLYHLNDKKDFIILYKKTFYICLFYGIFAYTFIYSFADFLMPLIFGEKYIDSSIYAKEMFATMLLFSTSLLQANILIAMKMEKLDMWFNIISVVINSLICVIGLMFVKNLSVVTYSIFISFLIIHILQDVVLIKKKITSFKQVVKFALIIFILISTYIGLDGVINKFLLFPMFWIFILIFYLTYKPNQISNYLS